MRIRTALKSYAGITFTLEAETTAVYFSDGYRKIKIYLCAECEEDTYVTVGGSRSGSLNALGNTYIIPQSFTIIGEEKTIIAEYSASHVDFESYERNGVANFKLFYENESLGIFPYESSRVFGLGKIYTKPEGYLVSGVTELGDDVTVVSSMASDGYVLQGQLFDGDTLISEGELQGGVISLPTSFSVLADHASEAEFVCTAVISASLAGSDLPETLTFPVTLKIAEGDCLPVATVTSSIVYTDELSSAFGVAVRMRSYLSVSVSGFVVYHGAHIANVEITVDGETTTGITLETGVFTEAGTHGWQVVVTDTRGLKRIYSGSFEVYDYLPPDFEYYIKRTDISGTETLSGTNICAKAGITEKFLTDKGNVYSLRLGYRKAGTSDAFVYSTLTDGTESTLFSALDPAFSYETVIECSDSAGSVTRKTKLLECVDCEINIAKNKVAVGKYAENERLFDCAWNIKTAGDVTFSDGNGSDASLRAFYNKARRCIPVNVEAVSSESDITAFAAKYDRDALSDGFYVILLISLAPGLSVSEGEHLIVCFKNAQSNLYYVKEISVL